MTRVVVQIRCTEEQKAAWLAFAAGEGRSLSAWIKDSLDAMCVVPIGGAGPLEPVRAASTPKPAPKASERKPDASRGKLCSACQVADIPDPKCYKCWLKNRS